MKQVTINEEQELYVISCGGGYTCLGFEVLEERYTRLASELLNIGEVESLPTPRYRGTVERYEQYQNVLDIAHQRFVRTGWRSNTGLTPQLEGLEGRRVEVVDKYGEKRRFQVGKSTGWIPCHVEIARSNSTGGPSVTGAPFQSVRVIR